MINLSQYLGSQAYDDMCEKFVEQALYGRAGMYSNAISAWNSLAPKAYAGINGAQNGDLVYFSPNAGNGGNGHAGIYMGNNKFLSATERGVQLNDLDQWQKMTGQKLLGYVPQGHAVSAQQLGQQIAGPTNPSQPQPQAVQQPPISNPDSMAMLINTWNSTHHQQLPGYM